MTEAELEIRYQFNKFVDYNPQLKKLVYSLNEEDAIMLQALFEDFVKDILKQNSSINWKSPKELPPIEHGTWSKKLWIAMKDGTVGRGQCLFHNDKKRIHSWFLNKRQIYQDNIFMWTELIPPKHPSK